MRILQVKTHDSLRHAAAQARMKTELASARRELQVLHTICSSACKMAESANLDMCTTGVLNEAGLVFRLERARTVLPSCLSTVSLQKASL